MARSKSASKSRVPYAIPQRRGADMVADVDAAHSTLEAEARTAELALNPIERAVMIPRDLIRGMPDQPRQAIPEDDALHDLARSIAATGLLQPLVARLDIAEPGTYILIAGHRRVAAVDLLTRGAVDLLADDDDATEGLSEAARAVLREERTQQARGRVRTLPTLLRDVSPEMAYALALVENLQRENLSAREVMDAIVQLQDRFSWSLRQIAKNTHRATSGLSTLARVARYPDLAALVADDVVKPWTAGVFVALSEDERAPFVARMRAGDITTAVQAADALRQYRQAMLEPADEVVSAHPVTPTQATSDKPLAGATTFRSEHHDDGALPIAGNAGGDAHVVTSAGAAGAGEADRGSGPTRSVDDVALTERTAGMFRSEHPGKDENPEQIASTTGRLVPVAAHVREIGGQSQLDKRAEALVASVMTFLAGRPMLDAGSYAKFVELQRAIQEFVDARPT